MSFTTARNIDHDFSLLDNTNGQSPCDMEQVFRVGCIVSRSNRIRRDSSTDDAANFPWPSPSSCICNPPFFNIFSACLLSRGITFQPTYSSLQSVCQSAGISADSTIALSAPAIAVVVPSWVLVSPNSQDTFDVNRAFLVADSKPEKSVPLSPGVITAIVLGSLILLGTMAFLTYLKCFRPRTKAPSNFRRAPSSKYSSVSQLLPGLPRKPRKVDRKGTRELNWAIDTDAADEDFEILGRPKRFGDIPISLGGTGDPYAPNPSIHNPFNHNLAASTTSQNLYKHGGSHAGTVSDFSSPPTSWSRGMRKMRSFVYWLPVPWEKGTVAVRETKPTDGFSLDGSRISPALYDPPVPRSPPQLLDFSRPNNTHSHLLSQDRTPFQSRQALPDGSHPQDLEWRNSAASRDSSRSNWNLIHERPITELSFEELSQHYDVDTTEGIDDRDLTSRRLSSADVGASSSMPPATVAHNLGFDTTSAPLQPLRGDHIRIAGETMDIVNHAPIITPASSSSPNAQSQSPLPKPRSPPIDVPPFRATPSGQPVISRNMGRFDIPPAPSGIPPAPPPSRRGRNDSDVPVILPPPHALTQPHIHSHLRQTSSSFSTARSFSPPPPSAPSLSMYASEAGSFEYFEHQGTPPAMPSLTPVAERESLSEYSTSFPLSSSPPPLHRENDQAEGETGQAHLAVAKPNEAGFTSPSTSTLVDALPPYIAREGQFPAAGSEAPSPSSTTSNSTSYLDEVRQKISRSDIPIWSASDKQKRLREEGVPSEERDLQTRKEMGRERHDGTLTTPRNLPQPPLSPAVHPQQTSSSESSKSKALPAHLRSISSSSPRSLPIIPNTPPATSDSTHFHDPISGPHSNTSSRANSLNVAAQNVTYESPLPSGAAPPSFVTSSYPIEWDDESALEDILRGDYSTIGTNAHGDVGSSDDDLLREWSKLRQDS